MSCDWDVYCRTCNESLGLYDMNHADEVMQALIRHAPAIAALQPLMMDGGDVELTAWGRGKRIDVDFFVKHAGHDLAPRDEYGRCLDECGERIKCGCGHAKCYGQWLCNLKKGHGGDHDWLFVAGVSK